MNTKKHGVVKAVKMFYANGEAPVGWCVRPVLSGQPIGSKSETVCCVVCGKRRDRFVEACPICYP